MKKNSLEELSERLITQEELERIEEAYKKRYRELEEENEILKKSALYFSQQSKKG